MSHTTIHPVTNTVVFELAVKTHIRHLFENANYSKDTIRQYEDCLNSICFKFTDEPPVHYEAYIKAYISAVLAILNQYIPTSDTLSLNPEQTPRGCAGKGNIRPHTKKHLEYDFLLEGIADCLTEHCGPHVPPVEEMNDMLKPVIITHLKCFAKDF